MVNKVVEIVQSCKNIILKKESSDLYITEKGACDFVTQVDYEIQDYLEGKLADIRPTCVLISEEQNLNMFNSNEMWILDPIDGTTNLIHGYRQSAISLAYVYNGIIEFGIIYNPYVNETFLGIKNKGAFLNGKRIQVSKVKELSASLIAVGTSPYNKQGARKQFGIIMDVFEKCRDIRRSGAAAIDIANVAAGRTEGFFESHLKPWDFAAGVIILQEAGGTIVNWEGEIPSLVCSDGIIATNGHIHNSLLKIIQKK